MTVKAPRELPRRVAVMAACAVLGVLFQLVLAQLTLAVAVLFAVAGRVSRWHRSWLLAPVAVGLVWALAAGPGHVIAGFAAGPAQVLRYFGQGHVLVRLSHPLPGFAAPGGWLPKQLPLALITGAAEAAMFGWLAGRRAGQQALPRRPGAVAALRGAFAARMIRAGAVLTRNGCALGVARETGAVAELRWAEIAGGAVVSGPVPMDVTVTCLQVAHAALRRRKPLIVIDPRNDAAIALALAAACAATGTPLRHHRDIPAGAGSPDGASPDTHLRDSGSPGPGSPGPGSPGPGSPGSGSPGTGIDLLRVVGDRSAVLLAADSPQRADRACAAVTALAAELRRIGVGGDGLVWVTAGESLPGQALAALIRQGAAAGLPVLAGVTSPAAATKVAGCASAVLTLAPRPDFQKLKTLAREPCQFSLAVRAPRCRQLQLAHVVPARLPGSWS